MTKRKISVLILDIIIALYFFVMASILFLISAAQILIPPRADFGLPQTIQELIKENWGDIITLLFVPFFIYLIINFFRSSDKKYKHGKTILSIYLAFLFINYTIHRTYDFSTILLNIILPVGIPFGLIYLTKHLNEKTNPK